MLSYWKLTWSRLQSFLSEANARIEHLQSPDCITSTWPSICHRHVAPCVPQCKYSISKIRKDPKSLKLWNTFKTFLCLFAEAVVGHDCFAMTAAQRSGQSLANQLWPRVFIIFTCGIWMVSKTSQNNDLKIKKMKTAQLETHQNHVWTSNKMLSQECAILRKGCTATMMFLHVPPIFITTPCITQYHTCAMADDTSLAKTCLLLVCGLPGSGKSTFCHELVTRKPSVGRTTSWIHFCYDEVERALREDPDVFDPETWQEARARITTDVTSLIESDESNRVIVLDDNMYYRSMRALTVLSSGLLSSFSSDCMLKFLAGC